MTQTILIGKTRRITLDELRSLSRGEAKLEMQAAADAAAASTEADNAVDEAAITTALSKLSLDSSSAGNVLSAEATIASLALLSLILAQGRVVRGDCALQLSSALVDLVNTILSTGKKTQLPCDAAGFVSGVNSLVGDGLKDVLEDKPYLGRCISLARISLMLTQGTLFVCFALF